MPDSNNQIIKIQSASPINTVNLGTIPKTNYSSVLASTYDPYTLVHSPQPIQTGFPRIGSTVIQLYLKIMQVKWMQENKKL